MSKSNGLIASKQRQNGREGYLMGATKYVVKKDIVISAGTVLSCAPIKTERYTPHFLALVSFGPDYVGSFTIDEDAIEANRKYFEKLNVGMKQGGPPMT